LIELEILFVPKIGGNQNSFVLTNPEDCENEIFLYGDNETETGNIVSGKDEIRKLIGGSIFE
jgi:hypothetical protein